MSGEMSEESGELVRLVAVSDSQRDWEWEKSLFQALVNGKVKVVTGEPQEGPNGWPYIFVEISEEAEEPTLKLLQWLSDRGIGMAVNGYKESPDYLFSYGMIWSYRESAQFVVPEKESQSREVIFEEGQKIFSGEPSPKYLPEYVRVVLRQFLQDQQIETPHVLAVSRDEKHYDLCFSLESLGSPNEDDQRDLAEALVWFLPTNYSIVLVPSSSFAKFYPL
ncbi:hypothetical protein OAQ84_01250 [Bdellovibrionales bacterium]|nr:hypothetical protein [Bdellovibrionales bacterium]